jgi:hypothetical protein
VLAAFAVVVGSGPGAVPTDVAARIASPQPPAALAFDIAGHVSWASTDASVLVGAWCDGGGPPGWAWRDDHDGLCVVTGALRRLGSPWTTATSWPATLASVTRPFAPDELDELAGEFSGVVLDPMGRGVAVTDPFAHRGLYLSEGDGYAVVASTPALAAVVASPDQRPTRDPWGVCGLAYTKHRIGERTGFLGVRSMPIGSYVELGRDRSARITARRPPWEPEPDLENTRGTELLDVAHAALVEAVTAAARRADRVRFMDLTGGKDSRLLLGLALTGGVAGEFVFRTSGPPSILDVQIAAELAEIAGVRWVGSDDLRAFFREQGIERSSSRPDSPTAPWSERMRRFVAATAGFCNVSDAGDLPSASEPPDDDVPTSRVNGLAGELLRSMLSFEVPDDTALVRRFDRHFGHLDLLRPEAFHQYRTEWIDELLAGSGPDRTPNDRHDAFLLRSQVRSNFGPRLDLVTTHKLMPLSSVRAVRAAYAMGGAARVAERVHREIVRRASPALADHRFAKDGWHTNREMPSWARPVKRGFRRRRARDLYDDRLDRPKVKVAPKLAPNLTHADHKRVTAGYDEPVGLLRDLLADRSNPAWDLIDPVAVAEATDRYEQLPRAAHVELMGAATAAIWLATS